MQYRVVFAAACGFVAQSHAARTWNATKARNFIYIVPDGFGPASQTMARDYVSLLQNGENPSAPVSFQLAADKLVLGNVQTLSSDDLITDSAASATAFACGVKTYNDAVGVDASGSPVGTILEAAHLAEYKTGLVVTSVINHATPACYSAHVLDRNSYEDIAAQQIGYSHPLGSVVDLLFGGGRCYYKPQSDSGSCRSDDVDLFSWAEEQGYRVMQNREQFDKLEKGKGEAAVLPYIGLFNDDQMMYEIDRVRHETEPSLLEMVETALNTLDRATADSEKGYFLMIEASRIDHAGHANDPAAHLHDIIMYNDVVDYAKEWIDAHPDTLMMSAADHECGGLTLNGFNPLPLRGVSASLEEVNRLWSVYNGTDRRGYLVDEILPMSGLAGLSDDVVDMLLSLEDSELISQLSGLISDAAGVHWSTGGHSAVDVTLIGYGAGSKGSELRAAMAGNWDNTELPRFIENVLSVDLTAVTQKLRASGTDWVPKKSLRYTPEEVMCHKDYLPTVATFTKETNGEAPLISDCKKLIEELAGAKNSVIHTSGWKTVAENIDEFAIVRSVGTCSFGSRLTAYGHLSDPAEVDQTAKPWLSLITY
ncbi:hypothetical protein DL762_000653 [Monosporascus cannonballus]|uniref:Alkaline phosphatase n=1 Tax=Monosporascus cannonballus TaxID=155416 RepID=A0ABY0HJS6_9PEZI|nr:hypothetical protein DL763_008790 [Monosporascus cannonballus]RYO94143.1 hypothetical protein DL762_000653 [Monosporascus cannonballus]